MRSLDPSGSSAGVVRTWRSGRPGFTLIELLVVIGVLAGLMGMTLVVLGRMRHDAKAQGTRVLVRAAALDVLRHQERFITIPPSGNRPETVRRLFDFAGHGFLDGDPARDRRAPGDSDPDPGFSPADQALAAAVRYRGFLHLTGFITANANVDARGRLIDAWKRPLRIAFAQTVYGPAGFGIWSVGPDGVTGTADDITSWQESP